MNLELRIMCCNVPRYKFYLVIRVFQIEIRIEQITHFRCQFSITLEIVFISTRIPFFVINLNKSITKIFNESFQF